MTKFDFVFFDETLLSENPVFVEAGTHSGRLGNFLYEKGKVIIYEPSKVNFEKLKKNIEPYIYEKEFVWGKTFIYPHAKLWNKALDSFNSQIPFFDYVRRPSSASTFKRNINILDQYMVEAVNIKNLMEENNIGKIDLLVLTCEGCELRVLRNIFENDFNIKQICVSFQSRLYGLEKELEMIKLMSKKYKIIEGDRKWRFYLLIKK